ncbi:hypothetical protein K8Z49_36745 [Actinomadura madurae]|uniref:DNA-binding transcriptional activator of the SARP family n=1 Tax=Actinomadura madurae TaxID=1993 RepID=A0A1I5RJ26_9ACTN|nr:BTAD domain-containing putative transcriptional regulator [Actinomadura madurae]SFP58569.1 DNA-binding transcriptional activator of the SARP family [Actinomadura madurae]
MAGDSQLTFGVLGPLRVRVGHRQLLLSRISIRRLLGVLLLTPGQQVDRQQIVEVVWGPSGCEQGALYSAVWRLRAWLRSNAGIDDVIHRVGQHYLIDVPEDQVDCGRFRSLVHTAAQGIPAELRVDALRSALDLWRGSVLSDCLGPVAPAEAPILERTRLEVAGQLAEAALSCGRFDSALEPLQRLAASLPYDEVVHAHLITLLGRSGRRAEGLRYFEEIRRRLVDELGVDPSGLLRSAQLGLLHESVPQAPTDLSAPAPAPARVLIHRMPPPDLADFTGRREELAELTRFLTSDEELPKSAGPVVAISGRPGVGKTALAVRLASRLATRFPDGELFVDLHGYEPHPAGPAEVLVGFLRALGAEPAAIPVSLEERTETLRARLSARRVLVVLDNARPEQIRPLLPPFVSNAVIVTSRIPVGGLCGMRQVVLDMLDPTSASELLARIIGPARADAEPAAVRRLAGLCGNLPLALRITGARLAARPSQQVSAFAEQLADEHQRLGPAQVAHDLEINVYTLQNRVKNDREQSQFQDGELGESEREELVRLRAERAQWEKDRAELEMERDVLKRSVAVWVKDSMNR